MNSKKGHYILFLDEIIQQITLDEAHLILIHRIFLIQD